MWVVYGVLRTLIWLLIRESFHNIRCIHILGNITVKFFELVHDLTIYLKSGIKKRQSCISLKQNFIKEESTQARCP